MRTITRHLVTPALFIGMLFGMLFMAAAPSHAASSNVCVSPHTYRHVNGADAVRCTKTRGFTYVRKVFINRDGQTINVFVVISPYGRILVHERRVMCC